jgi:hypothetical protein
VSRTRSVAVTDHSERTRRPREVLVTKRGARPRRGRPSARSAGRASRPPAPRRDHARAVRSAGARRRTTARSFLADGVGGAGRVALERLEPRQHLVAVVGPRVTVAWLTPEPRPRHAAPRRAADRNGRWASRSRGREPPRSRAGRASYRRGRSGQIRAPTPRVASLRMHVLEVDRPHARHDTSEAKRESSASLSVSMCSIRWRMPCAAPAAR